MTDEVAFVRMPADLHRSIKKAAKRADLTMAQWMRQAAREKLAVPSVQSSTPENINE